MWTTCVLYLTVLATVSVASNSEEKPRYTNSWAVEVHGGPEAADALASKYGFINRGQVGKLQDIYNFEMTKDEFGSIETKAKGRLFNLEPSHIVTDNLKLERNVGLVEQQVLRRRVKKGYVPPTDPRWSQQWSLFNTGQSNIQNNDDAGNDLNVEPAWIQGYTGCNSIVGVVDDGVGYTNTDLKANYLGSLEYDYADSDPDPFPVGSFGACGNDHGTCCAGEIAMEKNNEFCGIGVAYQSSITGIRLLGENEMTDIQEASALGHMNDIIDIYSNSWGPVDTGFLIDKPDTLLTRTFENGVTQGRDGKGSIFVWAAGNGGEKDDSCAADGYVSSIYTIAIGSAASDGTQAYYDEDCSGKMAVVFVNNPHRQDSVTATTADGGCNHEFDGTSAATPLVSGVMALVLEANPDLTWRDVQYLIAYTSNPDILSGGIWTTNGAGLRVSHQFGFGAIDAEAMVTRAQHWINVPEQQSDTVIPTTNSGQLNSLSSTLRVTIPSSGNIRFLEHVVVTMTLSFDITEEEYDDVTQYLSDYYIDGGSFDQLSLSGRGDIQIELSSPSGTSSVIYPYRVLDVVPGDLIEWPFMSVHYWGEDPEGDWVLTVQYTGSDYTVSMSNLRVTFYGTTAIPQAVSQIPDTCDSVCARGCAKTGSEFCDACGSEYLRNATTLECVAECSAEYAVRSKYCYDPNAPEPVCNRTIVASPGGGTGSAPPSVAASFLLLALCAITGALSLLF